MPHEQTQLHYLDASLKELVFCEDSAIKHDVKTE